MQFLPPKSPIDISSLAVLPPAPLDAMVPAYSFDPAVQTIHRQLAALHCAAFVVVFGPPPQFVAIEPITVEPAEGPPQPVFSAVLQPRADAKSHDWFVSFQTGLNRWEDAHFRDPIIMTPSEGNPELLDLVMTTYDDAVRSACRRMLRVGHEAGLRNLVAHCDHLIPSRYDPDHPDFPVFRRRF